MRKIHRIPYFSRFLRAALAASALALTVVWSSASAAQSADVEIDASRTFQTMEGFGTCLISWSDYPEIYQSDDYARFYTETVGLNMLRISLTFFRHPEEAEPRRITADRIEVTDRAAVFVDFAKRLKRVNPDARLIASVWSPPPWMKLNGQGGNGSENRENRGIGGDDYRGSTNRVDPDKYEHFVAWLVALVELHEREGIPLYALSLANEPRFSQWYDSCVWTAPDYAKVLKMLGHALQQAGHGEVRLFGPEDMTGHLFDHGTKAYIDTFKQDREALRHLDVFATHGYTDGVNPDLRASSSSRLQALIEDFDLPYWMTEGGTGTHDHPGTIADGGIAVGVHNSLVETNAAAFIPWQISDKGNRTTHGIASHDRPTAKTHAFMQFTRVLQRGDRRIATGPASGVLLTTAFVHPGKAGLSVILINPEPEARSARIYLEDLRINSPFAVFRTDAENGFTHDGFIVPESGTMSLDIPGHGMVSLIASDTNRMNLDIPDGLASGPEPLAGPRTFTDTQGRSIKAVLMAVDLPSETVVKKRWSSGGRTIHAPTASISRRSPKPTARGSNNSSEPGAEVSCSCRQGRRNGGRDAPAPPRRRDPIPPIGQFYPFFASNQRSIASPQG